MLNDLVILLMGKLTDMCIIVNLVMLKSIGYATEYHVPGGYIFIIT